MLNTFHLTVITILVLQLQNTYKFSKIPILHEHKLIKKFCQLKYLIELTKLSITALKSVFFVNKFIVYNVPSRIIQNKNSKIIKIKVVSVFVVSVFFIVLCLMLNLYNSTSNTVVEQLNHTNFSEKYNMTKAATKSVKEEETLSHLSSLDLESTLGYSCNISDMDSISENGSQVSTTIHTSKEPIRAIFETPAGPVYKEFKLVHLFAKLNNKARSLLNIHTPTVLGTHQYFSPVTQQLKSLSGHSYNDNVVYQLLKDLEGTEKYSLSVKLHNNMLVNYVGSFQEFLFRYIRSDSEKSTNGLIISLANLGLLTLVTNEDVFNPVSIVPMQGYAIIKNRAVEVVSTPITIVASQFDLTQPLSEKSIDSFKERLVEFIDPNYEQEIQKELLNTITNTHNDLARVLVSYFTRGIEYYVLYSALSLDLLYLILNPECIKQGVDNPVKQLICKQVSKMKFIDQTSLTEVKFDPGIIAPRYKKQDHVHVYGHKLTEEDLYNPGDINLGSMLNYLAQSLEPIFETNFSNAYSKFIESISESIERSNRDKVLQQFIHSRIKQYWKKPSSI